MIFTPFSIIYLATSVVAYVVGWMAQRRKSVVGAKELSILTYLVAFCAFILSFESAATSSSAKIILTKVSYISVVLIPVYYLLFVVRFTKLLRFKDIRQGWLLFVFPCITFVLACTNEYHHWIWSGFSPISPETNIMTYHHGFWFWIGYTLYSYLLLLATTHFLFEFIRTNRHRKAYVLQGWLVSFAGLCPWVTSFFYILGVNPVEGLDITPISTTLCSILFSWSILKSTFLNLVPIARETLVETLPIGILAVDEQTRIQDINQAGMTFLGITTDDVLGKTLSQVLPLDSTFTSVLQSDESSMQVEVKIGKSSKWFRIIKKTLKNNIGSQLITIFDMTDEVNQREALIQARKKAEENDQLKSAFLSNLSHEIRTPLNGIMGFISILQSENLTEAERSEYLNIVWKSGDRLLKTMVDIIDISKIESGQLDVNYTEVDVQGLLSGLYEFFKPEANQRNLELSFLNRIDLHDTIIRTDQMKLFSILTNLIKNALKFTTKGFVKFESYLENNELCISVSDSGIGLTTDQMELIFHRFVQVDTSKTRRFEGSGLGLSISKAYAEILGGKILVTSQVNVGSTFTVRLPLN